MTKITKNKLLLSLKNVDVHTELKDTVELLKKDIDDKQIEFEINFSAEKHFTEADPSRLQQVFWNLLKNAIKFTPISGKITVTTINNDSLDNITIRVTDSGIGIFPAKIIFANFQELSHKVFLAYSNPSNN